MVNKSNTKFIAIVGPSASGKSFLAKKLARKLGGNNTAIIAQDWYYKDWSQLTFKKREKINFDHPNSFDFRLLGKHLWALKKGIKVKTPVYSFKEHMRLTKRYPLDAKRYIIIEGLFLLYDRALRNMLDFKIYVDIDKAIALPRRIKRDLKYRGETLESVCSRYFQDVLPMQKRYVEKQKKWADIVIDGSKKFDGRLMRQLVESIEYCVLRKKAKQ